MRVKDFKPTAVIGITNLLSLVLDVKHEDGDVYVYSAFCSDKGIESRVTRAVVNYNQHGNAYFTRSRQRYYLSEAMRLNYV